ncbi:bridge-like lipid transfer protein family member 3B [Littorina saxatilis]|uniref:bridge-like lipid transfer protein family member 3B n=1 Tax=Littorina saxatilis TaxID=31220 RepID=UPI0038B48CDA
MASLLKNQILKHLYKYTKNLSSDKLNVSTIKGEGELSNLELDEDVLTDLLELPTWLKITRASCNRVAIKIQWTKLKSQPICLYLDEVVIEMETCETPRPPTSATDKTPLSSGGKYGFIDKVMDGIFVHINSVIMKMMSRTFNASLQLSRVKVHSTTPTWSATNDLRTTRIRDSTRGEILLFKEIEWQTTRIEAAADESWAKEALTPLRLIANQAKIRIALKKRLSDCSILSSRVILLLDDLLWVLTITQLKAAILYANSLKEVIERSSHQSKRLAAEKLKKQGMMGGGGAQQQQQARPQDPSSQSAIARLFARFDVTTTSYHLVTSRFDLHLCDDTDTPSDPSRHWDISNGSMQITFYRLSFDFYPFHPAGGERKGWFRYMDNIGTRNPWVQKLFASFREDAVKLRKACGSPAPSPSASSSKILGGPAAGSNDPSPSHSPSQSANPSPSRDPSHLGVQQQQQQQQQLRQKSTRLLESCCVIKVEDLTLYMVSTPNTTKRSGHQKFLVSDKKQLHLPADMSVVHMEYTEYYFPEGVDYPVPHPNLYILVNPVRVTLDFLTMLWSQYFLFTLAQGVDMDVGDQSPTEHIDVKLEALMPRVIVPAEVKVEGQPERPEALQMQISKLTASNCRIDDRLTLQDLRRALDVYYRSHLFHTAEFPNDALPHRLTPWQLENHASNKDNPFLDKSVKNLLECDPNLLQWPDTGVNHLLTNNSLKKDAFCDVWGLHLEQVWVEFLGVLNFRSRPVPCVEAFPLTLWLGITYNPASPASTEQRLSVQSTATLKSDHRGSNSDSPLPSRSDERPGHLVLSDRESFDDCHSLQSEELNMQQPRADSTAFLLTDFGGKMRVQVNHYQYLFFNRLTESFTKFQEELAADLALWGSTATSISHLPVHFDEAELAIVCPYQMHQRTFSDDFSPSLPNFAEVFTGPGSSVGLGGGGGHLTVDATLAQEAVDVRQTDMTHQAYQADKVTTLDNNNIISILNTDRFNGHPHGRLAQNPSSMPDLKTLGQMSGENYHPSFTSDQPHQPTVTIDPKSSQMSMSAGTDSGIGLDRRSSIKSSKQLKGADVKKAFSSAFSNFTDKLKNTFDDNLSDDLDSMSMKTDTSDDDDMFERLSLEDTDEVPAFIHEGRSDAGSNLDTCSEVDTSSIYADSSTTKGKELVSVILFKLDGVEGLLQVCDTGVYFCGQVSQVTVHQPGNVGYDDFYSKFSSLKGFVQEETTVEKDAPPRFPIRFKHIIPVAPPPPASSATTTPATAAAEPSSGELGSMVVRLEDYSLQFKMSGLTCLTDFMEDEKPPEVVPMSISVRNFLVALDEDRPGMAGTPPMNCNIDELYIQRGLDGIYHITSGKSNRSSREGSQCAEDTDTMEARAPQTPSSTSSFPLLTQTQAENAQLRRQCDELNRANKFYEEQILLLRDKMRELELAANQTRAESPSAQRRKSRSHSISSITKNHVAASPGRTLNEAGVGASGLESENVKLLDRVMQLEVQLDTSNKEKESLVATLQFLQEELLQSERRSRSSSSHH